MTMLMKKTYVTPQLSVQEFIPNEFVAGCSPQEMVEGVSQSYPHDQFYIDYDRNGIYNSYVDGGLRNSNQVNQKKLTGVYYPGWYKNDDLSQPPQYILMQMSQSGDDHWAAYKKTVIHVNRS